MDAAGVIAYYVMDGNRPLTATTGSDTTSYLYGLGVIGEESNAWSYGLTDGTNTQRQLTDALGEVTYSARYTPWGDTLETYGSGNFAFGYFGGLMDAATGLLYVGDGQYYDPSTGRFLTRGARPNSPNPYLPFDPTGALFLPLALVSLVYGRKRRKSKWDILVIVTLLSLSAGMGVAACQFTTNGYDVTATPSPTQPNTYNVTATPTTVPSSTPAPSNTPLPTITATCTLTPSPTPGFEDNLISFTGWSDTQKSIAMDAILAVGAKLSPFMGGIASTSAFLQAYRVSKNAPFQFIKNSDAGGGCAAGPRLIKCNPNYNPTDPRLIVHELGHALHHANYPQGVYAELSKPENAIVDDDGQWVTGKHPNGNFERTFRGYQGDRIPHVYHGMDVGSEITRNTPNEDFADMFMNWVYNSFDDSASAYGAGVKRYNWIESRMHNWLP